MEETSESPSFYLDLADKHEAEQKLVYYLTVQPATHHGTFSINILFFCKFNMDPLLGEKWDEVGRLKALRLCDNRDKCTRH